MAFSQDKATNFSHFYLKFANSTSKFNLKFTLNFTYHQRFQVVKNPSQYCIAQKLGESSLICQTKTIQISTYFITFWLNLFIRQTFFHSKRVNSPNLYPAKLSRYTVIQLLPYCTYGQWIELLPNHDLGSIFKGIINNVLFWCWDVIAHSQNMNTLIEYLIYKLLVESYFLSFWVVITIPYSGLFLKG